MNFSNIQIKVLNKTLEVIQGTTLLEISKLVEEHFKYPIILAKIDNEYLELSYKVMENCTIEFLDLTDSFANRVYVNGLVFLVIYSTKEKYPELKLRVLHSIDKGLYIETNQKITSDIVDHIKEKMEEVVARGMEISKINVTRMDAIDYFKSRDDLSKVGIMKYNTNTYVTLYKLGNMYNYIYSQMPVNTDSLTAFDLTYLNDHGFVLTFPTIYMKDGIKPYQHHPKIFEVFQDYRNWEKVIHLENVAQLNERVSTGNISDLIRIDETLQDQRLLKIAMDIETKRDQVKIILLAGPSSSGKTTTTKKLSMYFRSFGMNPTMISMDDYFVDREKTPVDENGRPDYERLDALDLDLFDRQIAELLAGQEVRVPTFNFLLGMKEYRRTLRLGENDVLMIEGIHALNKEILKNIPEEKKIKIYLSALTELNLDNETRISTTDNRLLRRIVRDNRTRGYSVEQTLHNWSKVREGEEKYIFPFQDDANYTFNTALIYEMGVLKTYAEPLLYSVEPTSPYYPEAKRLLNYLKVFLPIPSEDIPDTSLLREFIGGSCFHD